MSSGGLLDVYIDAHDVITPLMTLAAAPPGGRIDVSDVIVNMGDVNISGSVGTMTNLVTVNTSGTIRWVY